MEIVLKPDSGIGIFGRIGSGKTYLGSQYQNYYIQNKMKTVTLTPLRSQKDSWNPRVTCYMDGLSMPVKDEGALMLTKIYNLGNYTVFLDEAHMVMHQYIDASNNPVDLSLSAFVRHRRHRNVGLVILDQRIARIYGTAIAQCDYIIAFRQKYQPDIDKLAENCSPEFAEITTKLNFENHEYAVYDMRNDSFEVFKSS